MIVRIFRGSFARERRADFRAWIAGEAAPHVRAPGGAGTLLVGTVEDDGLIGVVVVTTWSDLESEIATLGDIGPRASLLSPPSWLSTDQADHYELVEQRVAMPGPSAGDELRIDRIVLRDVGDEPFFDAARSIADEVAATTGAWIVGRRMLDDVHEVAVVALVPAASAHDDGNVSDWSSVAEWIANERIERFEAVALELAPV